MADRQPVCLVCQGPKVKGLSQTPEVTPLLVAPMGPYFGNTLYGNGWRKTNTFDLACFVP